VVSRAASGGDCRQQREANSTADLLRGGEHPSGQPLQIRGPGHPQPAIAMILPSAS
jgi:hypothetical protein